MAYYVSGGTLNLIHSLTNFDLFAFPYLYLLCYFVSCDFIDSGTKLLL